MESSHGYGTGCVQAPPIKISLTSARSGCILVFSVQSIILLLVWLLSDLEMEIGSGNDIKEPSEFSTTFQNYNPMLSQGKNKNIYIQLICNILSQRCCIVVIKLQNIEHC